MLKSIYSITDNAFREYVQVEDENDRVAQLKSEVPGHDLVLIEIRKRLEGLEAVKKFHTENNASALG
ncbi:MAG: hypothetical protein HY074_20980 [Deltaproteobacteria bacterium]|nr:hypothetical protein [Deltaproteobacteria bacterium]